MKKLLLLPLLLLAFLVQAQGNYQAALGEALTELKASQSPEETQSAANKLSRIATAEPKAWLPAYYATYAHIVLSFQLKEDTQRDAILDQAQTFLDKALTLEPKESELHVLQGYLHQARLSVSPMSRGMKYSGLTLASLEKAKALNPENPRTYFLLGQHYFNMPKMVGGGKDVAKPVLTTAVEKYAAAQPATSLSPSWGMNSAKALLAKCE
ncbi:hypothetical protein TH61_07930 [Rufibacter sp. DG15C]|uniref:hypothetical protein n=1 Tax=Rufibacter sp. DG15C TaxID=1379909 RepID=UPI00078ECB21|nr:hypothetical protein [Rufibacter sp. DG15C]AMM51124.1 hypothetical protein TH61_07930 [Rufibacter sp. DG15C]